MQIDCDCAALKSLVSEWQSTTHVSGKRRAQLSRALRYTCAYRIVAPAIMKPGQLILTYHEFLARVPSGAHSFAHGSGMQSQMVYWVTVARLPSTISLVKTKEASRTFRTGVGRQKIRVSTPAKYLLPVRWKRQLWPIYPGLSSRPNFTLERPDKKSDDSGDDKLLNVGELGEHLFRIGPADKFDWATKIFVVIGTRSVKAWLTEHGSLVTYEKIQSQTEFR